MSAKNRLTVRFSDSQISRINEQLPLLGVNISSFIRECVMTQIELLESGEEAEDTINYFDQSMGAQKKEILLTLEECMRFIFYMTPDLRDDEMKHAANRSATRMKFFKSQLSKHLKEHGIERDE